MSVIDGRTELDRARDFLRGGSWLAKSPEQFRGALLGEGLLRHHEKDDVLMRQGDRPDGLWAVIEGGLALDVAPHENGPNRAHMLRPGFWFGEIETLTGSLRLCTIVATRPSVCLHVTTRGIEKALAQDASGWRWIGQLCAGHLALAMGATDDLMIRPSESRLAALLLRLADARLADNPRETTPEIDASHEDLGAMANLSRSAIGRILREFEDNRLIDSGYGRVRILDQPGLRVRIAR